MRLTSFILFALCIQVAARSNGQGVNLSLKNATVTTALKEIQAQTGYNIIADQALLDRAGRVNLVMKNTPLEEALRQVLRGSSIGFVVQDHSIVLRYQPRSENPVTVAPVLIPVAVANIITGQVVTSDSVPLVNASVQNLATKKGTFTSGNGSFSIEASPGDMLMFSYVGFISRQIRVTSSTYIHVVLQMVEGNLEEFVATGYQNIRKTNMTGATARVKAEDLLINGSNTIEQMLQGKLAGVEVVNNSGLVGTRQTVRVRGVSTLLGNQQPVWVVDGIIQEDPLPFQAKELNRFNQEPSNSELLKNFIGGAVSWLNPYDIEDVTVLKDAASTAIYGVKAANGVILINTKRGLPGRTPVVSYNTSLSTQSKLTYTKMNLMNSKERVDVSREIWERGLNAGQAFDDIGYTGLLKKYLEEKLSYDEFNAGVKQLEVNNTDWLDILMQQPLSQAHNLSISGGSANSSYYGSLGVNSQKGQAKGNGSTGYQGSINFTSNITPKLGSH